MKNLQLISLVCWHGLHTLHGNVLEKIQTGSEVQIQERRDSLKHLVAVATFLSKQGISLRGHDESENILIKGKFDFFDAFLKHYSPPSILLLHLRIQLFSAALRKLAVR